MTSDERYMQMALELAEKARGYTSPNPMVGTVIVRAGEVLARGYHRKAGMPHAEVEALSSIGGQAPGATLYVNLEPCAHVGRTGPCSLEVIKAGVSRVVVGVKDLDPRVNGVGIRQLRDAGIEVVVGVLEKESRALNAGFFCTIENKRPHVTVKVASSLDSKIATHTGDAKWLSGEEARAWGHQKRAQLDAILVGAGTVIADDPALTVRWVEGKDPLRVVLDSRLRTPLDAQLYGPSLAQGTVVFCSRPDEEKKQALEDAGVRVFVLDEDEDGRPKISAVLAQLKAFGCLDVLVEGGGEIHGAFFAQRCVDRLYCVVTPWLIGADGISAFGFQGPSKLQEAIQLEQIESRALGPDLLLGFVPHWPSGDEGAQ